MDETEKKLAEELVRKLEEASNYSNAIHAVADADDEYGVWVERESPTTFVVTLNGMYGSDFYSSDRNGRNYGFDSFSFKTLEAISEVFKTKNINIGQSECHREACESCGYNGFWGLKIWVHDAEVA